jgi:hypothetical protein
MGDGGVVVAWGELTYNGDDLGLHDCWNRQKLQVEGEVELFPTERLAVTHESTETARACRACKGVRAGGRNAQRRPGGRWRWSAGRGSWLPCCGLDAGDFWQSGGRIKVLDWQAKDQWFGMRERESDAKKNWPGDDVGGDGDAQSKGPPVCFSCSVQDTLRSCQAQAPAQPCQLATSHMAQAEKARSCLAPGGPRSLNHPGPVLLLPLQLFVPLRRPLCRPPSRPPTLDSGTDRNNSARLRCLRASSAPPRIHGSPLCINIDMRRHGMTYHMVGG